MRTLEIAVRMFVREPIYWALHPFLFVRVAQLTVDELDRRGYW